MPISVAQALDLLVALIVVMFLPIGLWRGALREWVALAGSLGGAALAAEWAYSWGSDLASAAALEPRVGRFTVGALLFLLVTLVVGYGAGLALPYRPDLTWSNRLLGAAISFGNGLFILSSALRIMQHYLFDDADNSPLLRSALAHFLIDAIGWPLLALSLLLAGLVVASALRRWNARAPLLEEYALPFAGSYGSASGINWRRVEEDEAFDDFDEELVSPELVESAPGATWSKPAPVEPLVPAAKPTTTREALAEQDTAVLPTMTSPGAGVAGEVSAPPAPAAEERPVAPVARPEAVTEPALPSSSAGARTNRRVVALVRPTQRREASATPTPTGAATVEAPAIVAPVASQPAAPAAPNGALPTPNPESLTVCRNCGATMTPRARFCLSCGHIIGTAERRSLRTASSD